MIFPFQDTSLSATHQMIISIQKDICQSFFYGLEKGAIAMI